MSFFASAIACGTTCGTWNGSGEFDIKDPIKIDEQQLVGKRSSRSSLHDTLALWQLNMSVKIFMMSHACPMLVPRGTVAPQRATTRVRKEISMDSTNRVSRTSRHQKCHVTKRRAPLFGIGSMVAWPSVRGSWNLAGTSRKEPWKTFGIFNLAAPRSYMHFVYSTMSEYLPSVALSQELHVLVSATSAWI